MKAAYLQFALAGCLALAGCTAERAYSSGQAWQRNECDKLPDFQERQRCLASANTPYSADQKQVEQAKKPN